MKKLLLLIIVALCCATSNAQAPTSNTAFKNGETVNYSLKFSLGLVNIDVGTAVWSVSSGSYNGQSGHKVSLRTASNKRADKYFVLRDTLTTYVTPKLVPLYYEKRGREGKRYKKDWVKYSYGGGKCNVSGWHRTDSNTPKTCNYSSTACAYDMVSMMLRARSMNPASWKVGHRENFIMADGRRCAQQSIVYRGKETIKLEGSGAQYKCLVFSFLEKEGGKEKELIKFYITDDANHLPVRLDLSLTFGSAKAYMTSCSGLRNPQTAKVN